MLQVIPKWEVGVTLDSGKMIQFWISDNFLENVMRQVASMSFSPNPTVRVSEVRISAHRELQPQIGVTIGRVRDEPPNQ